MPFTNFVCIDCGQEFTLLVPAGADFDLPECPACGSINTEEGFAADGDLSEDCSSCSEFR